MKLVLNLIIFLSFLILLSPAFSQDESLTITTYYPSPNGSYHQLHSDQMTIGSSYRSGVTPPTDGLIVQNNVGIGTINPPAGVELHIKSNIGNADIGVESNEGYKWTMSSDNTGNWILNRDIPGTLPTIVADQSGNVGIGTMSPQAKLEVNGDLRAEINQWGTCIWRNVTHQDNHIFTCKQGEFVAGVGYEDAEWTDQLDNHIFPEVNRLYCCKI